MQKEYHGEKSIQCLTGILKESDPKYVFIVTGKRSFELSGAKETLKDLLRGINVQRYCDFDENPKISDLIKGARLIRDFNPDLVVTIGGGSVIDTAKVISVLPNDLNKAKAVVRGELPVPEKLAPMVAIPTTSGSGSEATHFAVVYMEGQKYSVAKANLLPDQVILDPELTYSLSAYQTAVSGMDALCQGIESYWAINATDESKLYAAEAIGIIFKNLEAAVKRPDKLLRYQMAVGSNLAGKAINISKTTAPHALSYGLTQKYGIPHGHAVAITMGEFLQYNTAQSVRQNHRLLIETMSKLHKILDCKSAECSRKKFLQLMENIGLETKLGKMSEEKINIDQLVQNVNTQRLANHPLELGVEDLKAIFTSVLN